jgi:hypothetical protein
MERLQQWKGVGMSQVMEKIGGALLTILSWFKNPELIVPEPQIIDEIEDTSDSKDDVPKTLSELLDDIEETFNAYKFKFGKHGSWLHQDEVLGLKKLGSYVPSTGIIDITNDNMLIDTSKTMPSMMLVSVLGNKEKDDESKTLSPDFMFGIKVKSLPWYTEKKTGTIYKVGLAYRMSGHLYWIAAWIVVKKNGEIDVCKEHRFDTVQITKGKNKHQSYKKPVFSNPDLITDWVKDEYEPTTLLKALFKNMFDFWVNRKNSWSVAVKHSGDRVTFSIDKSLTKKYFSDRDKTAVTPTGQKKKIIHFVKQHERKYENKTTIVKEHIRGMNDFTWKGYKCLVTAPEFQGLATADFNVSSVEADEDEISSGFVSTSKVGLLISQMEERQSAR